MKRVLRSPFLVPLFVAVAASGVAAHAYLRYLEAPRQLWHRPTHDRSAHYLLGLSLALDVRNGDVPQFLRDLNTARVWGPLYGLLLGVTGTVGAPDYRLALLPSLFGWVGTALLAFLIGRRLVPSGGTLAGLFAALFVIASPAHQAFATDIMTESLGACLSLFVLYHYLVWVQDDGPRGGVWLALSLSLLFFYKYNYWLLTLFGLAAAELTRRPGFYRDLVRAGWQGFEARAWLVRQLRHPLTWCLLASLGVVGFILFGNTDEITLGGRTVSIRKPHNAIHAAYIFLFLRLLTWWMRGGRQQVAAKPSPVPELVYWHAWPIALWFLLPKRLGFFLWFLSPANRGTNPDATFLDGVRYYWAGLTEEYHPLAWTPWLVAVLSIVGLLAWRRLRPGSAAVLWFLVLAAFLTVKHPNHKSRHVHSWVAAGWLVAGAGLAVLVYGPPTRRIAQARPWLAGAGLAGLTLAAGPAALRVPAVHDGGPLYDREPALLLTENYLPQLSGGRAVVVSNLPVEFFARWTYLQSYRTLHGFETEIRGFADSPADNRAVLEHWLKTTRCEALVYLDIPPGSTFHEGGLPPLPYQNLPALMREQQVFSLAECRKLEGHGCSIYVWKRDPSLVVKH